jgi:hypothetical protein
LIDSQRLMLDIPDGISGWDAEAGPDHEQRKASLIKDKTDFFAARSRRRACMLGFRSAAGCAGKFHSPFAAAIFQSAAGHHAKRILNGSQPAGAGIPERPFARSQRRFAPF